MKFLSEIASSSEVKNPPHSGMPFTITGENFTGSSSTIFDETTKDFDIKKPCHIDFIDEKNSDFIETENIIGDFIKKYFLLTREKFEALFPENEWSAERYSNVKNNVAFTRKLDDKESSLYFYYEESITNHFLFLVESSYYCHNKQTFSNDFLSFEQN